MKKPQNQRHTEKYRKARKAYFASVDGLCELCKAKGVIQPAHDLDHIVPIAERPDLFWDEDNWQALCIDCHREKTLAENKARWGHDKAEHDDAFKKEIQEMIKDDDDM